MNSINKKYLILLILILLFVPISLLILMLNKNQNSKNFKGQTIIVRASDIQKEIERKEHFYKFSKQDLKNYPTLSEDAKNRVIENAIIENYASSKNISASDKEINARYQQKISSGGEQKLLIQLSQMYGMSKADYMKVLKQDILREKIQRSIEKPLSEWIDEQKISTKIEVR